jgi:hypothetical protein
MDGAFDFNLLSRGECYRDETKTSKGRLFDHLAESPALSWLR